jgi:glycosyltransferase involved in cell wall biosynthesis
MTTLTVIVDPMLSHSSGGVGRYTEELTRELVRVAPPGCDVAAMVAASREDDLARLKMLLPGIGHVHTSRLRSREFAVAMRFGLGSIKGKGMVHSTSLLAPLGRHDRLNNDSDQIVVTIHDVAAWTHPELLDPKRVAWEKAMVRRAQRFADAVVVPTHSVASQLGDTLPFGDRIRVIGGAVSSKLQLPVDADERAHRLGLPERYLLSVGTLEPRKGLPALISALGHPDAPDLPLLLVGPRGSADLEVARLAAEAGLAPDRVRNLGFLADPDLAVVMSRANVFVFPSLAEGFGLPLVEAFHFGTPVIHSDEPAVLEVSAGAGIAVPRDDAEGYPARLAAAIADVIERPDLAQQLHFQGLDRARAFSWSDSAHKVWQLHADL